MNFRITTDYILQIFNVTTQGFHTIWVAGEDGKATLQSAKNADSTSTELDWDYQVFQLPDPPLDSTTTNYRKTNNNVLQLLNVDTKKWHTLFISGNKNNPKFSISKQGEI